MAFWLEPNWQREAIGAIKEALHIAHSKGAALTTGQWTKQMFVELSGPLKRVCERPGLSTGCGYGGGGMQNDGRAWLYDCCVWLEDQAGVSIGVPVVVESEWSKNWKDVCEDFYKLVQARAGLRVMIFQQFADAPTDWGADLLSRAQRFSPNDPQDAWLLASWSADGFKFRSRVAGVTE